jgi:zinc D-Ala-D-Ala carboxypeptidase
MKNARLSSLFNLEDFTLSETALKTGIVNEPPADELAAIVERLRLLAVHILDKVAKQFDTRPQVSSGYRCPILNEKVGGLPTSQHQSGHAVDFELPGQSLLEVARWMQNTLDFDQLLLEQAGGKTWIHVSYVDQAHNRREVKWFDGSNWHEGLPNEL